MQVHSVSPACACLQLALSVVKTGKEQKWYPSHVEVVNTAYEGCTPSGYIFDRWVIDGLEDSIVQQVS